MSEKLSLTYVEIDIPFCALRYGETTDAGACPAVLGVDSVDKCFNSRATCPVRASYLDDTVTLRFGKDGLSYRPEEIECIPSLVEAVFSPGTIKPGESLGERSTLTVTFKDGPHPDTGPGYDKYRTERSYDPFEQGTYWGKFRARQPFMRGQPIRLRQGYLGQTLDEMETRHFFIESCTGPTMAGTYSIEAKDIFKQLDGDRAMAPAVSTGYLSLPITDSATTATLAPAGIGDAEYDIEGYLAIGGKEVVTFKRWIYDPNGENDPYTKIMLHLDGSNGGTTFTDSNSGGSAHTWSAAGGGATTSTTSPKFGTASLRTGASEGGINTPNHSDFNLGSAPWTVDLWWNANGASAGGFQGIFGQTIFGGSLSDIGLYCYRDNSNKIIASAYVGSTAYTVTSTTSVNGSSPVNIAFERDGNTLKLFINGTQEGGDVAISGAVNYIPSATFGVGCVGSQVPYSVSKNVDEFRLSVGIARYSGNFTPKSAAYDVTAVQITTGDVLTLTGRAQLGTTPAQAHKAQDRVQTVLYLFGEDVSNIIELLMVDYAGIDEDFIPIGEWLTESEGFLGTVYTTVIAEPTPVRKLIDELIEQAALCVWWDDLSELIRLTVLRAISTDAALFDEHNRRKDTSLSLREQPEKQVSQVWTYYARTNPLKPLDDLDNYRSTAVTVGGADEDSTAIRVVLSRWIPENARAIAQKLNYKLLGRYKTAPRAFGFSTMRYSECDVELGRGYNIGSHIFQDATGARVNVPIQVTRLVPAPDRFVVEAEEMQFDPVPEDISGHLVIIDTDGVNKNLRTIHDSQYSEAESGDTVICVINAGVVISSASTTLPAFDIGSWPSGVDITVVINGTIQGAAGNGGRCYSPGLTAGAPGLSGGVALYTRYAIDLEISAGAKVWGGGGGGGGGGVASLTVDGGGGGGGAGRIPGIGGIGGVGPGASGTDGAGGVGSGAGPGGYAGGNGGGSTAPGGAGGAAGYQIDGVSYVTVTVNLGDRRGPTVN